MKLFQTLGCGVAFGQEIRAGFSRPALLPCTGSARFSSARPLREFGSTKGSRQGLGTEEEVGEACSGGEMSAKSSLWGLSSARCEGQRVTALSSARLGPAQLAAAHFDFPDFLFRVRFMKL